jgi:hypothetical protein
LKRLSSSPRNSRVPCLCPCLHHFKTKLTKWQIFNGKVFTDRNSWLFIDRAVHQHMVALSPWFHAFQASFPSQDRPIINHIVSTYESIWSLYLNTMNKKETVATINKSCPIHPSCSILACTAAPRYLWESSCAWGDSSGPNKPQPRKGTFNFSMIILHDLPKNKWHRQIDIISIVHASHRRYWSSDCSGKYW